MVMTAEDEDRRLLFCCLIDEVDMLESEQESFRFI